MKKAVFLDRDGTINVDKGYTWRIEDLELFPGTSEAIRLLNEAGYLVIVVTNQAGVAKGFYTETDVRSFNMELQRTLLAHGAWIDDFYYCPHHPEGHPPYNMVCKCRKPAPGMIIKAAQDWKIDLNRSWIIGDKWSDLQAGLAAGCKPILVLTGEGMRESVKVPTAIPRCLDLRQAAKKIIAEC